MTNLDATCIAAPPTVADRATFISRGAKGAIEEVTGDLFTLVMTMSSVCRPWNPKMCMSMIVTHTEALLAQQRG